MQAPRAQIMERNSSMKDARITAVELPQPQQISPNPGALPTLRRMYGRASHFDAETQEADRRRG